MATDQTALRRPWLPEQADLTKLTFLFVPILPKLLRISKVGAPKTQTQEQVRRTSWTQNRYHPRKLYLSNHRSNDLRVPIVMGEHSPCGRIIASTSYLRIVANRYRYLPAAMRSVAVAMLRSQRTRTVAHGSVGRTPVGGMPAAYATASMPSRTKGVRRHCRDRA